MIDLSKEIEPENLTQKDIMTFLLHSTQHTATREELQEVKVELKEDINKVETSLKADINKIDIKFDRVQWLIVSTIVAVLLKDQIIGLFTTIVK